MHSEKLVYEYLTVFVHDWSSAYAIAGLERLLVRVQGKKDRFWSNLLAADLTARRGDFVKGLNIVDELLTTKLVHPVALLLKARILCVEGNNRFAEALTLLESVASVNISDGPSYRLILSMSLWQRGVAQDQAGKSSEAIDSFNEVMQRFGDDTEPALREVVAKALVNKGAAQGEAGKLSEAIDSFNEVAQRFSHDTEPALRVLVAKALVNKGLTQREAGKLSEAIDSCNEVVQRFGDDTEPALREQVANALVTKAVAQAQAGKSSEAIDSCNVVVQLFSDDTGPALREQVAKALVNKGVTLGEEGKPTEAINSFNEVVQRFGDDTEPALREVVATALLNKGFWLKAKGEVGNAIKLLEELGSRYNETDKLSKDMAKILATAYSLRTNWLSGKPQPDEGELKQQAVMATRSDLSANLSVYLKSVLRHIDPAKQQSYFDRMDAAQHQTDLFLSDRSHFLSQSSFLLILRQWNSYTPVIPAEEEADRGGGYFFFHGGEGVVIDPGYDFIDNFYRAGGRLRDIDHIVVTHAHDDHTAELEALLMLLHQHNSHHKENPKQVSLYLSVGVHRKFAGLLNLRDTKTKRLVSLVWAGAHSEQRIPLNDKTTLYVLPAYHDDVITRDMSVGLGFILQTTEGERRIAFTGDSGLFPRKCNTAGDPLYYDELERKRPQLDTDQAKALYSQYPDLFKQPHLLVAHIGSIKRQEFEPPDQIAKGKELGSWYYPNHLGMLGTLAMLHQIDPKSAIISEFGSELRGFHADLVDRIGQALHERQEADKRVGSKTFVIPGDLTIAYDIANHKFLCHDNCKFMKPEELVCRLSRAYKSKPDKKADRVAVDPINDDQRVYLFSKKRKKSDSTEEARDCRASEDYYVKFFNHKLPYHAAAKKRNL